MIPLDKNYLVKSRLKTGNTTVTKISLAAGGGSYWQQS